MSCPCFATTMDLVVSLLVWIVLQILRLMVVKRYRIKVRLIQEPERVEGVGLSGSYQNRENQRNSIKIKSNIITIPRPS